MKTTLFRYALLFVLSFAVFSCSKDDDASDESNQEQGTTDEETDGSTDEISVADEIFKLVNEHRQSQGLAVLERSATADQLAVEHTQYMIGQGRISHDNQDDKFNTLKEKESARGFGENVAAGQNSAKSVMSAWLNSEGHRGNIEGNYTHIGIGAIEDQNGNYYYTQIFYR